MGAFFTNVQVYTGKQPADQVQNKVIDTIKKWALANGYVEATTDEMADRTIVVGPAGPEPWITVFDEATEDQDEDKLNELASTLSASITMPAVSILVHDSDVLVLRLFRDGNLVDININYPDYFDDDISPEANEDSAGHPERWSDLLVKGAREVGLRTAWDAKDATFAEENLLVLAKLFNWNPDQCSAGFNYLDELNLESVTYLRFRSTKRPPEPQYAEGPPIFKPSAWSTDRTVSVNEELTGHNNFFIYVHNIGGESRGLIVGVWGPAIEQHLINPKLIEVGFFEPERSSYILKTDKVPQIEATRNGERAFFARFPDFKIKPGIIYPDELPDRVKFELSLGEGFLVYVSANVINSGKAVLYISALPYENFTEGQTTSMLTLTVD